MSETVVNKGGRPTLYNDDIHQSAIDYITGGYIECEDVFPSVVGMAVHLNVAKSTLYKWEEDKREGELGKFSDTLDQCQDHQERITLNKSISGDFNPTISKLVLANFGYHDKADATLSAPGGGPVESIFEFIPVDAKS